VSRCDRCGEPIAGTAVDPIHVTSLGTHHEACMRLAWRDHYQAQVDRQEASRARRSASQKARRAKGTPPVGDPSTG